MAKYTDQYKVPVEEIIEYNTWWGNTPIDYMANIRQDIENRDTCDNGEVWEATLWAEHVINQQATEKAKLTRRVAELEADKQEIHEHYDALQRQTAVRIKELEQLIETITLDGTDEPTAPDTDSTHEIEAVEPLDSSLNEFMQASWDVADPKRGTVQVNNSTVCTQCKIEINNNDIHYCSAHMEYCSECFHEVLDNGDECWQCDYIKGVPRYYAIEFATSGRVTVWDALHRKEIYPIDEIITNADATWHANEMNTTTCETHGLKPSQVFIPPSAKVITTEPTAPDTDDTQEIAVEPLDSEARRDRYVKISWPACEDYEEYHQTCDLLNGCIDVFTSRDEDAVDNDVLRRNTLWILNGTPTTESSDQ